MGIFYVNCCLYTGKIEKLIGFIIDNLIYQGYNPFVL